MRTWCTPSNTAVTVVFCLSSEISTGGGFRSPPEAGNVGNTQLLSMEHDIPLDGGLHGQLVEIQAAMGNPVAPKVLIPSSRTVGKHCTDCTGFSTTEPDLDAKANCDCSQLASASDIDIRQGTSE